MHSDAIGSFVTSYVVNSAWQLPLLAAVAWAACRMLQRLGPQAQHRVWVGALGLGVVTPALPVLRGAIALLHGTQAGAASVPAKLLAAPNLAAGAGERYTLPPVAGLSLLVLYAASVVYFAVRFALSLRAARHLRRAATPLTLPANQQAIWLACVRSYGLRTPHLMTSSRVTGPVVAGARAPALLLPPGFAARCTDDDLLAAFAHECGHIRRRDFAKNLAYEAASLVLAYHPVTWWLKARIAQSREMICDTLATRTLMAPRPYAQSLLRLATMLATSARVMPTHAIGIFDANILETRIMNLTMKKPHVTTAMKFGLALPAALLLLSAAAGGAAFAVTVDPQTAAQPYGQLYTVGKDVTPPKLVFQVDPEFPEAARQDRSPVNGNIVISLVVDKTGIPHEVHATKSFNKDFDAQAVKSVEQWRFKPAMHAGQPVAMALNVKVNFARF